MLRSKNLFSRKGSAKQSTVAFMLSIAAAMSSAVFLSAAAAPVLNTGSAYRSVAENAVTVTADGTTRTVRTETKLVGELLADLNYSLGTYDTVNVPLDAEVCNDMDIEITRVKYVTRKETEIIEYGEEMVASPEMMKGKTQTVREGVDGFRTKTVKEKYVNGEMKSCEVLFTDETEPVNEIVEYGTALADPISKREGNYTLENGIPTKYEYMLDGKVTAYTAREGCGTYSGRPLVVGSVAVDPDIIPFGSELYIVSKDGTHVYGYAIASDTGDLTQAGVLVDVYMGTTDEHYGDACRWGAQFCNVYVISVGDNSVSWR